MKRILLALVLACIATPTSARLVRQYFGPTAVVLDAPVERAIENIGRDRTLSRAQRERLIGRLHLIAYVQADVTLTGYDNGEWLREGVRPCGDPAFPRLASCTGYYVATPEIPTSEPAPRTRAALRQLRLSRTHYRRSIALDDSDLRAHLGLAYILDQLGELEAARARLCHIAELALARAGPHGLSGDDQAVAAETLAHLRDLAVSESDRALLRELELVRNDEAIIVTATPIVVPLIDAPFDALADTTSSVAFDFAGTGNRHVLGWLTTDATWLVWDPQQRGQILSGFDMVGQRTWAVFWRDGFEAMRALDDDRDGQLTGAELEGLALWRDADSDGVSDAGEVQPLSAYGIVGLAVNARATRPGLLTAPGGVRLENGARRDLYDWTPGLASSPVS